MKPNCFGLPSVHDKDSPECAGCAVADECSDLALAKAVAFSRYVNTADIVRRLEGRSKFAPGEALVNVTCEPVQRTTRFEQVRIDLTVPDQELLEKLPVKVAKKATLLMQSNMDREARAALRDGKNPFPFFGSKYLHLACRELLNGGFTRSSLRAVYMKELGWTEGTAFSHVSAVVSLFPALRFAQEQNGTFVRNQ